AAATGHLINTPGRAATLFAASTAERPEDKSALRTGIAWSIVAPSEIWSTHSRWPIRPAAGPSRHVPRAAWATPAWATSAWATPADVGHGTLAALRGWAASFGSQLAVFAEPQGHDFFNRQELVFGLVA